MKTLQYTFNVHVVLSKIFRKKKSLLIHSLFHIQIYWFINIADFIAIKSSRHMKMYMSSKGMPWISNYFYRNFIMLKQTFHVKRFMYCTENMFVTWRALGRLQLHWFCNLMSIFCLMTTFISLSKNQHYHIVDEQTTYIGVQDWRLHFRHFMFFIMNWLVIAQYLSDRWNQDMWVSH